MNDEEKKKIKTRICMQCVCMLFFFAIETSKLILVCALVRGGRIAYKSADFKVVLLGVIRTLQPVKSKKKD